MIIDYRFITGSFSLALGSIALYETLGSFSLLFYDAGFWIIYFIIPLIAGILLIRGYYGYISSRSYFRNTIFFGSIFFILYRLVYILRFFTLDPYFPSVFNYLPAGFVFIISIIFFILIVINWSELVKNEETKKMS